MHTVVNDEYFMLLSLDARFCPVITITRPLCFVVGGVKRKWRGSSCRKRFIFERQNVMVIDTATDSRNLTANVISVCVLFGCFLCIYAPLQVALSIWSHILRKIVRTVTILCSLLLLLLLLLSLCSTPSHYLLTTSVCLCFCRQWPRITRNSNLRHRRHRRHSLSCTFVE